MRRFFINILQAVLSAFFVAIILVFFIICFGIGVAGGFVLGCWEDVASLNLQKLEYKQDTHTWRQHLEVYSSICKVQLKDTAVFLVDKLDRLEYEKLSPDARGINSQGQYFVQLSGEKGKQRGTIEVFTRQFDYPIMEEETEAKRIYITINSGKIETIKNVKGISIRNFYLEPELLDEFAADDAGTTRRIIPLAEMPNKLKDAFIAIEDRRFYQHSGIDIVRLVGAIVYSLKGGDRISGTSTLTQQLTRNVYLGDARTPARKTREILLAFRIEKSLSKDQILEGYLNFIDFGRFNRQQLFGIQKAAMEFFGKEVSELEFHECALLAALPKGTTQFSPIRNPKNALSRRNVVLRAMYTQGFITQKEYEYSRNQPLGVNQEEKASITKNRDLAGHYIAQIRSELDKIPELQSSLYKEGLKAYTTIDMSMQSVAVKAVGDHLRELDKRSRLPNYDVNKIRDNRIDPIKSYLQAALIAFDPRTGDIKALVGGRDYTITEKKRNGYADINFFNRTIGNKSDPARRQPGSAFKPIVFASLMEEPSIVTPATIFIDELWGIVPAPGQKKWHPRNYSRTYKGPLTVREIIKKSINVPTARAALETPVNDNGLWEGIDRIVQFTKKMGIDSPMQPTPALTLGASGMTVLELTAAYGVFANRGMLVEPSYIKYVVDASGKPVYTFQPDRTRVLDERIAYQVNSFLESVIKNGTGIRAISHAHDYKITRPIAGKTGTTNNNVDAWFVGYSTDLVVGVWVGFDVYRRNRHNYNEEGAKAALPIWARFMKDASRGPEKTFPVPEGIEFWEIDKTTGLLRNKDKCPPENISNEPFLEGQAPTKICDQH